MTELEKEIKEVKNSLQRIEKALGIGSITPAVVININRKAMRDAEAIKERKNGGQNKRK